RQPAGAPGGAGGRRGSARPHHPGARREPPTRRRGPAAAPSARPPPVGGGRRRQQPQHPNPAPLGVRAAAREGREARRAGAPRLPTPHALEPGGIVSSLALLRRAAADPNQPEWRLRLYAEEEAIAASVAGNPAISLKLMLRLGKEHPRALAQNPALVLHASIAAGFLTVLDAGARLGRECLPGVLEDPVPLPECPVPVVEFAIGHPRPGLYRALLNNPTLSAAQLLRIEKQVRDRRLSRVRISDVRQHTNHPQPLAGDPEEVLVNELSRMHFSPWATRTAMAHGRVGARLEHLLVAANPIEALPHCHT